MSNVIQPSDEEVKRAEKIALQAVEHIVQQPGEKYGSFRERFDRMLGIEYTDALKKIMTGETQND